MGLPPMLNFISVNMVYSYINIKRKVTMQKADNKLELRKKSYGFARGTHLISSHSSCSLNCVKVTRLRMGMYACETCFSFFL